MKLLVKLKQELIYKVINKKYVTPKQGYADQPIFFIAGSGRNGSTLLALILNRHPDIFLPPEQFALPYSIMDWYIKGSNWNKYISKQIKHYLSKNQSWKLAPSNYDEVYDNASRLHQLNQNPRGLFYSIFTTYSKLIENKSARVVGDHSPLTTLLSKFTFPEFANDKFIFLIRHPFDVILSYQKLKDNPASDPTFACEKWNNSVRAYGYLVDNNCDVLLVKYEDLVTDQESIITQIVKFLGVDSTINIIESNNEANVDPLGAEGRDFHSNLYKPVNSSAIGKWKKKLDSEIVSKLKPKLMANAERFGYDLDL